MILTPKIRKTLDIATRLIIAAVSLSYIFYRIYALPARQVNVFFESVLNGDNLVSIGFALVFLMGINWSIESLKWKWLINQAEEVSFLTSFQAVLGGLTG